MKSEARQLGCTRRTGTDANGDAVGAVGFAESESEGDAESGADGEEMVSVPPMRMSRMCFV